MKVWKKKSWRHEITGFEGNTELFGVNIFDYVWEATGEKVSVCDLSKCPSLKVIPW